MNTDIKIRDFIGQVTDKMRSADDVITSIGAWTGYDNVVYTVHCKDTNGNAYDIDIRVNLYEEK